MTKWVKFKIKEMHIKAKTKNSLLIEMPRNSNFSGFSFWLSRKFCKYEEEVFIPSTFEIKLAKRERLNDGSFCDGETITINASKLNDVHFDGDDTIRFIEVVPAKLDPVKNLQPDESLLRENF